MSHEQHDRICCSAQLRQIGITADCEGLLGGLLGQVEVAEDASREAVPVPGRDGACGLARPPGTDPRPQRGLAAAHPQLEAEPRSRLPSKGGADPPSLAGKARKTGW